MNDMLWTWLLTAVIILVFVGYLGQRIRGHWSGALVDSRGRYSLTQFQIVTWTIVLLSLITGVWFGRLVAGVPNPLEITLPSEVLSLMGISVGSTVLATAVKSSKDQNRPEHVRANPPGEPPKWEQVFEVEEGSEEPTVDVTKFQNFWITLILVVAYVAVAVDHMAGKAAADVTALPQIDGTFVTLLGISHAGYLAGKLPHRPGTPGASMRTRRAAFGAAAPPPPAQ